MLPFRGFLAGFTFGFGSGVIVRVMAENDFEYARDVIKTAVGMAQKTGDAFAETYGRLVENFADLRSQIRAEQVKHHIAKGKSHAQDRRAPKTAKKSGKKTKQKSRMTERELHA